MFFNSGIRGARARDGVGSIASKDQYVQKIEPVPSITSYAIQGSDDQALNPAGGQTVVVTGTGFAAGLTGIVGGTNLASVTVVSPYQATFTSPAAAPGSYTLILSNSSGTAAIYIPGLTYSSIPTYTTAAGSIGTFYETTAVSTQVVATSDSAITYSLASGALPVGSTLYANGVITGSAPVDSSSTTYSFSITATDAELQDVTRSFTLTINTDVVTWTSPTSGTVYTVVGNSPISNVTLSATSAAGYGVTYAANALPAGLTLSSGVISGTPTTEANTTSLLTATASTTNRSATNTIYWVVTLNDSFFKYNSLLMSSTVVTNTFATDLSSNNLDITINGDTKPSKFDPFELGYYSGYFDGTGDYLLVPDNNTWAFSGDFTIESWIYPTTLAAETAIFTVWFGGTVANTAINFNVQSTGRLRGEFTVGSSAVTTTTGTTTSVTANQWNHVAVTRSGTTIRLFVNGVQDSTTGTLSGTINNLTQQPAIGALNASGSYTSLMNGYISNLRVVNGTALYTTTFTPSTTPLTAIANTSLLTCQSSRFVDNSANAFTITVAGNTLISSFQPFTPNSSYATYGSTYFDGTGDYLTVPNNGSLNFSTGDFTVEGWFWPTTTDSTQNILSGGVSPTGGFMFGINPDSPGPGWGWGRTGVAWDYTGSNSVIVGSWQHVAVTRSGTSMRLFVNGIQIGATQTISTAYDLVGTTAYIVSQAGAGYYFPGYISNLRVVKGTAVYTSAFTPPTTPLTAITNTSLLTCQTVVPQTTSVFVDESGQNNLITRNGNTNIGTFSPLNGSWSNSFDGTGDYLSIPTNTALDFSTGDFTVEAWVLPNALASDWFLISASGSGGFFFGFASTSTVGFGWGRTGVAWDYRVAGNATVGVWQHVAVTRSGTSMRLFVNGTQSGTTQTISTAYNLGTTSTTIGSQGANYYLNGYISNLRVVKGTAVYTAAFTPSTTPLNSIANTSLLTCNSPSFVDYSPINNVITKQGDTTVNKFSPFPGYITNFASYSGFFDGTGDYLTTPVNAGFDMGTGDFTVECFVINNGYSGSQYGRGLFVIYTSGNYNNRFMVRLNQGANVMNMYGYNGSSTYLGASGTNGTITLNNNRQWYHIAVVRQSGVFKLYVDGVQDIIVSNQTSISLPSSSVIEVGRDQDGSIPDWNGYISNFRVVKGTAVYTATFTPPTAPLTVISGTSLLTCQSTTFIDNSANALAITVTGNTKPVIQNPFANTFTSPVAYSPTTTGSSMYFDGTGDYLSVPGNAAFQFTANFTVECWVYLQKVTGFQVIVGQYPSSGVFGWMLQMNNGATMRAIFNNSVTTGAITTSATLTAGVWNHVALTRSGSTCTLWFNGTSVGTSTLSGNIGTVTDAVWIGNGGSTDYTQGYISNVRILKGTALYTAPFVPSNSPLPAVQNTVLLVSSTITPSVYDAAEINDIENLGASKLTTSNSPYYSSYSGQFDGSGDDLATPSTSAFAFGTADFTVEGWVYITSAVGSIVGFWQNGAADSCNLQRNTSGNLQAWDGADRISSTPVPSNTWCHVVFCRSGATAKIFVNGVQALTWTSGVNYSASSTWNVGYTASGSNRMFGYISNVRVVKGTALYTAAFTPPTAPLTAIANTSLLTCQSNRFIDNSTNAFTITRNGDTKISALQPFGGSNLTKYSSVYFDGTGDYLSMLQNPVFALRSDYTIEAWVYRADSGVQRAIVDLRGGANLNILFYMNTSNQLAAFNSSTTWITSTGTVPLNQWAYVAISRSGTSVKLFINGVNDGTATNSDLNVSVGPAYIGRQNGSTSSDWMGYISDVRITNGYARYTTTFTPPTVPLVGF